MLRICKASGDRGCSRSLVVGQRKGSRATGETNPQVRTGMACEFRGVAGGRVEPPPFRLQLAFRVNCMSMFSLLVTALCFQNSGHGEIIHAIGTGRRPRCSRRAGLYRSRSTARGATDRIKKACRAHRLQRPTSQHCSQVALHPPAFELLENRCETTDMVDDRAPYVQSSGFPVVSYPSPAGAERFWFRMRFDSRTRAPPGMQIFGRLGSTAFTLSRPVLAPSELVGLHHWTCLGVLGEKVHGLSLCSVQECCSLFPSGHFEDAARAATICVISVRPIRQHPPISRAPDATQAVTWSAENPGEPYQRRSRALHVSPEFG
jgi:hypothetical protein